MMKKSTVLGLLALTVTASAATAQSASRPIELGIDGGITIGFDDPNVTVVSIPVQAFRVGFFMSDRVEIEPRLTFNSISGGGASFQTYALELGALFHPRGYRTGRNIYIRPFGGVEGVNTDLGDDNNGYLGAGVGIRFPFADRRLATRLEGNLAHVFADGGGGNRLGILFGLSWFTR